MNPAIVKVDRNEYSFLQGQARPEAARWFAIVEMLLLDEMTELPVRSQIAISGDRHGLTQLTQRPGKDGFSGLVGIPENVFRGVDLTVSTLTIAIECVASSYLTMSFNIIVGPIAAYPVTIGSALPVPAGTVLMHHEPVVFAGRVSESTGPVAGATVELHEFMLNVVTPVTSFVADARHPVALKARCYSTRRVNDSCRLVTIANGAASAKTLVSSVSHGSTHIGISNAEGLAAGDLLEIDSGELSEIIEIADVAIVADTRHINHSNAFAEITLAYPVAHRHQPGVVVRHRTATAAGPAKLLKLDAVRDDATLLMDDVAGWNANDVIRVSSAAGADEYHLIDFYKTTTDADGYYRLPAMNRLGQLSIRATQGVLSGIAEKIIPDYSHRNNLTDIVVVGP